MATDWWKEMQGGASQAPRVPVPPAVRPDMPPIAQTAPRPSRPDMPPIPEAAPPTGVDWWAEVSGQAAAPAASDNGPPAYDPERSAGLRATAVASLASNPDQRIQYYARERGVPAERYKAVNGRVAYQADDGNWYYEESANFFPRSIKEAGQQVAGMVGGAIPAGAGLVTGIASAPLLLAGPAGLGVSMAATGGAAAAGEAARQALANEFVAPAAPDRAKILGEGVTSALGQGIGAGMTALSERLVVPELVRGGSRTAQQVDDAATELERKAKGLGIHLTPAESTDLASLKAQQKMLGNMPQSADDLAAFYERRQTEQVAPAVNRFMDSISTESAPAVAGARVRDAATDAIEAAMKERTAAVRPLYEQVVQADKVVPRQQSIPASTILGPGGKPLVPASKTAAQPIDSLLQDKFFAGLVKGVKGNPIYKMGEMDEASLPVLDQVKKNLDDMIETARRAGERNRVRLLEGRRVELLKATDSVYPQYAVARSAFEARSPEVDEIANSVIGVVSKLKDTTAKRAASVLFSETSSSPQQIGIARKVLQQRDPEAWQAIKRSWLQMQWVKAGNETLAGGPPVNQGAKWRQALLGNETRRAHMKAALDPQEYAALRDLADVLEATGRVKPIGSDTAWNEEMKRLTRARSTPMWARVVGNAFSPQDWGRLVKDWASERALQNHAQDIVRIIQEPEARSLLRELKVVTPNSARWKAGVGHLLTRFATSSEGRTAPTQEPQR